MPGTSEACKFYHLFPLTVKGELSRVSLWYSLSPRRGGAQRSCCSPRVQEGRGPTSTTRIRRGNLPASTPDLRVTWRPRFVMCVTSTSTLPSADLRLHCGRENSGRSRRRTGPRVRRCRSRSTIPAAYGCKQKRSRCGTRRARRAQSSGSRRSRVERIVGVPAAECRRVCSAASPHPPIVARAYAQISGLCSPARSSRW